MYKIVITNPKQGQANIDGKTESKGQARAVAAFCFANKITCDVTRQAAEVKVQYSFATEKKK